MPYTIRLKPSAARSIAKVNRETLRRIASKLEGLSSDPRPHGCEKLAGLEGLFRVRVGDDRIVYQIKDDQLLVLVVAVGHRREVYRRR